MNIILTGFMGTGKSTVGKRLAKRLGWNFVDVDREIEARAGMPIARIFAERGEPVFRRLERRAVTRAAKGTEQVIATGGGAFVNPVSRATLRLAGPVICLTAKPQVIFARVGKRADARPLLAGHGSPLARIRLLLARRAAAYAQADLTVDTSNLSIDEVVERIWDTLSSSLCRSWRYFLDHVEQLSGRYGGKYVVVAQDRILASGDTQLEAFRHAGRRLADKDAGIYYIPLPEESLTAL
jgi:shikimate kinase